VTDSSTLLILGASGDLTDRLLLPGLGSLIAGGEPEDLDLLDGLVLVGSGRKERSVEDWRSSITEAFDGVKASGKPAKALIDGARYVVADPTDADDWKRLLDGVGDSLVIYFALPPSIAVRVVDVLDGLELPATTVLALEKPFGTSAAGAAELNAKLAKLVPENRIHRIDHFLGHRAVLALLALRFDNRLLEPVWNADNVERVEITYDEQLGLEGRAGFYDSTGAARDMLQSHLLQVLSVVAMEQPATIGPGDFRAATAGALHATKLWNGGPVLPNTRASSRRARYTAGTIDGKKLPSYVDEDGVDAAKNTETLAEMVLEVNTARWAGVPFVLRSGKAIGAPKNEIVVTLRPVRHSPAGQTGEGERERITLGFKPPKLGIALTAAGGSEPFELEAADASADLPKSAVTEYGEVMRGVLGDDPTLSVRGDVAEQCWRIIQPVLDAWRTDRIPLDEYEAGSDGPSAWS
jgi:glucose-6-phosphate 1-dehydrogenase